LEINKQKSGQTTNMEAEVTKEDAQTTILALKTTNTSSETTKAHKQTTKHHNLPYKKRPSSSLQLLEGLPYSQQTSIMLGFL
jgi:hypothetical protein